VGIGGSIAATGALLFIVIAVATVFFGETVTEEEESMEDKDVVAENTNSENE
jgi:hypothetical protein